eukprot:g825.t1 g825   contig10:800898-801576(-)
MKLSIALLAAAACSTSAFTATPGVSKSVFARSSVVMEASKNRDKIASRSKLSNAAGDTSDIYLYGGVVTSYVKGGQEYIAVRPDAKMDGSKPISGGLSHCWPQFGPGEIQQHGFARNVNWTVKSMDDTSCVLEMAPSDYTKEMWDKSSSARSL